MQLILSDIFPPPLLFLYGNALPCAFSYFYVSNLTEDTRNSELALSTVLLNMSFYRRLTDFVFFKGYILISWRLFPAQFIKFNCAGFLYTKYSKAIILRCFKDAVNFNISITTAGVGQGATACDIIRNNYF